VDVAEEGSVKLHTPRGCTLTYQPWTEAEVAVVRAKYKRGAIRKIAAQLGRSEYCVRSKAFTLGIRAQRYWTPAEDRELREAWGEESLIAIARRLNHPVGSAYERAIAIGLTAGAPPGYEYLSHAAKRVGYVTSALRHILEWADVPLNRAMSRPGAHANRPPRPHGGSSRGDRADG
jgi:hypothetical protein